MKCKVPEGHKGLFIYLSQDAYDWLNYYEGPSLGKNHSEVVEFLIQAAIELQKKANKGSGDCDAF